MPRTEDYHPLPPDVRQALIANGCTAEDWSRVRAAAEFRPALCRETRFSGDVCLGGFSAATTAPDGFPVPLGLQRAHLHNCRLGRDVRIQNIGSYIAHYDIGDGAIIENVDLLLTEGPSAFGNGVRVKVVNEGGGREVPIGDRLSAPVAYLLAFHRYRPRLVEALTALVETDVAAVRGARGTVGDGARVTNNKTLVNLRIGPHARVKGVLRLRNGSVNSSAERPTVIGDGVIAEDFIVGTGSRVESGAVVERCLLGQGVVVEKQYAAENSLVFANSELLLGEACGAFAGPYTVSHHKSSLLLTGLYSFYNAGSGTNFSNHMYKLGPVHQGVLERGCKTGSFSHVYWPSRVGAFSVIIGRHPHHVDTAALPFSYLLETHGTSLAVPGANLFTAGTRRDAGKWSARDRRATADRLDPVHTAVFNPVTAGRLQAGCALLARVERTTPSTDHLVAVRGVRISRSRLRKGRGLYELALRRYLGDVLLPSLEDAPTLAQSRADAAAGAEDEWLDLAGLLAPRAAVERLLDSIAEGRYSDLGEVQAQLHRLHARYPAGERCWAARCLARRLGREHLTDDDLAGYAPDWLDAVRRSNEETLRDAAKEFDRFARVGFGLDGDEEAREADFTAVRGPYDEHDLVRELQRETKAAGDRTRRLTASRKP